MAGGDKNLKIKVSTEGNPSGANQAADALANVTKEQAKNTEANKEAEKHFLGLNAAAGESRRIFADLENLAPGIRELVGAFEGLPGVLGLALVAANEVREGLKKFNEELDEAAKKLAEPVWAEAVKARQDALADLANDQAKYNDRLAHQITLEQQLTVEYARQAAIRAATATAEADIAKAQLALKEAQITANPNLTDAEKQFEIARARSRAGYDERNAKHSEAETNIKALEGQKSEAEGRADQLQAAVEAAEKAQEQAERRRKDKEGDKKILEDNQADLDKKAEAAKRNIAGAEDLLNAVYPNGRNLAESNPESALKLRGEMADQQKIVDAALDNKRKIEEIEAELRKADGTGAAVARARGDQESNNKLIQDLGNKIATAIATEVEAQRGRVTSGKLDDQASYIGLLGKFGATSLGNGLTAGDVAELGRIQDITAHGGKLNDQQQQLVNHVRELMDGLTVHHDKQIGLYQILISRLATADQKIDALTRLAEGAHSRMDANRLNFPGPN